MSVGDRDTAAAGALGALSFNEESRLKEDKAQNSVLAAEVEEYRAVVETLESGVARESPPEGLFDVVLSRIDAERASGRPALAPAPSPSPRRSHDPRRRRAAASSALGGSDGSGPRSRPGSP